MSISVDVISEQQKDIILDLSENHFCDVKSVHISPSSLTKTLSAFANADGGVLYVGVGEADSVKSWYGFENEEAANGHIQTFEGLFPIGDYCIYTFLACEHQPGFVLRVEVLKTPDIKNASDGIPRLRRGAQNLRVDTSEKLGQLELAKGISSFESETVSTDLADVTNSTVILDFLLSQVPTAEPETWLRKNKLIRENKPTVAGLLLFSELPQACLPKRCGIKIYRYKTREKRGTRETLAYDPITVEGCAYEQIREAVKITAQMAEETKTLGQGSLQQMTYPTEALHEIITNAVLHRDYSIQDDVHVRIFDNRIEVESPGSLPGQVTVKNILTECCSRNGSLVRIINKFRDPPNKDVGEGLNTAFEAMRKLRLKDPIIVQVDNRVIVNIRHEPLASPEETVMEYLKVNAEITNRIGRDICHIGDTNQMKDIFKRMKAKGLIENVPNKGGNKSAYRLRDPATPYSRADVNLNTAEQNPELPLWEH